MTQFRLAFLLAPVLITASCTTAPDHIQVADAPALLVAGDFHAAVDMLRDDLGLTDEQTTLIRNAVLEHSAKLREIVNASHEDQPDPETMISILAQSRTQFRSDLRQILTDDQWTRYLEHQDAVREAFTTAAATRRVAVMDDPLGLTDEQAQQMAAVIGNATAELIGVLLKFSGQRLGLIQKMELGRAFMSIRSDADKQLAKILSKDQMSRYKTLRKELAER